ncbi:MAG: hypothetical protein ACXVDN_17110 [Ktedonobacteraceae bacterium]
MDLPFQCETILEERICADVAWQQGALWGEPRPGHSEGQVMYHTLKYSQISITLPGQMRSVEISD